MPTLHCQWTLMRLTPATLFYFCCTVALKPFQQVSPRQRGNDSSLCSPANQFQQVNKKLTQHPRSRFLNYMDQKHRLIVNLADCWFPCKMTGKVDICTFSSEISSWGKCSNVFAHWKCFCYPDSNHCLLVSQLRKITNTPHPYLIYKLTGQEKDVVPCILFVLYFLSFSRIIFFCLDFVVAGADSIIVCLLSDTGEQKVDILIFSIWHTLTDVVMQLIKYKRLKQN